jgi:hypothetical protein
MHFVRRAAAVALLTFAGALAGFGVHSPPSFRALFIATGVVPGATRSSRAD